VVPILRLRDHEARGAREDSLAPGARIERTMVVPADDLGDGRWPFRVAVSYTDQNQYPFQALHVSLITRATRCPRRSRVPRISITPAREQRGRVDGGSRISPASKRDTRRSRSSRRRDIEVQGGPADVKLAAWDEENVHFDITNRTALAGSRYPRVRERGVRRARRPPRRPRPGRRRGALTGDAALPRVLLWVVGVLLVAWLALLAWRGRARQARTTGAAG
jgi:hypothetical protein